MSDKRDIHKSKTYVLSTLDPVHIGTGGYRMDRVDNTIIRDMDGIPKIPGSSLSGAIRAYAALSMGSFCGGNNSCNSENCPICQTFGYTSSEKSRKGLVSFYDAKVWFFPVATMSGPVWITTIPIYEAFIQSTGEVPELETGLFIPVSDQLKKKDRINLAWLMLDQGDVSQFKMICERIKEKFHNHPLIKQIIPRLILVSPEIFMHVVNDNLEVRTSVSINPLTGSAEDGALFTYEAIPRSTILGFDLVITDANIYGSTLSMPVEEVIDRGIKLLEPLGVGGMTTRGFGRVKVLDIEYEGDGHQ